MLSKRKHKESDSQDNDEEDIFKVPIAEGLDNKESGQSVSKAIEKAMDKATAKLEKAIAKQNSKQFSAMQSQLSQILSIISSRPQSLNILTTVNQTITCSIMKMKGEDEDKVNEQALYEDEDYILNQNHMMMMGDHCKSISSCRH